MRRERRLELVKDALRLLVAELDEGDTIGIVAFSTSARTVLEPTPASNKERILDAIGTLHPQSSTNVADGLERGYRMAVENKIAGGSNRVILLSDGVANTGSVDPETITDRVRAQRERGIYLNTVGVGMGNHNDVLLEQLADRGNGQCVYVDRLEEARRVFVENLTGTLETIAKDVKIQVEFDPKRVLRYRLLGYENRDVADSAFRDNTVDAGEVGAGHEVTALYELKLHEPSSPDAMTDRIATVRVRYLTVDHGEAVEYERPVGPECFRPSFEDAPPFFRLSACVAELAEVLRDSYWARGSRLDRVAGILESLLPEPADETGRRVGDDPEIVELVALTKKADALLRQREAERSEIARVVDAVKENYYLRARIEREMERQGEERLEALQSLRRQNEALRRQLETLLAR
jgi:Ca-activated chloride channel family protein